MKPGSHFIVGCLLLSVSILAPAATLSVGPGKRYARPCEAIAVARPGDRIEIDAGGNYAGDVCGWTKDRLTLVGIGGRAVIDGAGKSAQDKAIWVISGNDTTVENIEFSGAMVSDQNGAGIRQEGKNLTVRNCYFHDNQNGILTGDNPGSQITIETSEFARNGTGDGYTHNIYIGHVARLTLRFSYSHHARSGHLVKSRAAENYILYNRLTDEMGGTASYELELTNGGTSYVIGNLIEQSPETENSTMLAYMPEGKDSRNPSTALFIINNTFVNDRPKGAIFVNINASDPTPAVIKNNIFMGPGTLVNQPAAVVAANFQAQDPQGGFAPWAWIMKVFESFGMNSSWRAGDSQFVDPKNYDYRLKPNSPCIDRGEDPGAGAGFALTPTHQYVHPACGETRTIQGKIDIGAYEFGGKEARVGPPRCINLAR